MKKIDIEEIMKSLGSEAGNFTKKTKVFTSCEVKLIVMEVLLRIREKNKDFEFEFNEK